VIIGGGKDGLPIILGNLDTPSPPGAGATSPKDRDTTAKETTAAASPAASLEKTSAAALPTPGEKVPPAASATGEAAPPERPRSLWPLSLYDIETFFARMVRSTEPKPEPLSKQQ
jgi:hypothetical protein